MNQYKSIDIDDLNKNYLLDEGYKYALVYYLNDLYFGDIDNIGEIDNEIIVEAFFFNDKKELHFFEDNGFKGIVTEGQEDGFEETFILKKRLGRDLVKNKYKKVKVFNYLDYEKDGQAFVKYTALKGVE